MVNIILSVVAATVADDVFHKYKLGGFQNWKDLFVIETETEGNSFVVRQTSCLTLAFINTPLRGPEVLDTCKWGVSHAWQGLLHRKREHCSLHNILGRMPLHTCPSKTLFYPLARRHKTDLVKDFYSKTPLALNGEDIKKNQRSFK